MTTRTDSLVSLELGASSLRLVPFVSDSHEFGLRCSGPVGSTVCLQYSGDLRTWTNWQTLTLGPSPAVVLDDTVLNRPARFYRIAPPLPATEHTIPQVILDSDLGVDGDDVGDLVLLHKLADLGLCNIVATIYATSLPTGAPALEAINIQYGRPPFPSAPRAIPTCGCATTTTNTCSTIFPIP